MSVTRKVNGLAVCRTASKGGSEITALSKAVVESNSSCQQSPESKAFRSLDAVFTIQPRNVLDNHIVEPLLWNSRVSAFKELPLFLRTNGCHDRMAALEKHIQDMGSNEAASTCK
jgi:hypothetical protein